MRASHQYQVVDMHTAGSPVRVLTGGLGPVPGRTVGEKRDWLRANRDDVRTVLMYEPRGHAGMSGSIVLDPCDPRADVGIVFMEVSGWLAMCGHGTIGTITALLETGAVPMVEPVTELVVEVPAGLVRARAEVVDGSVRSVEIANVPSYLAARDVEVDVPRWGRLRVDVGFGGSFFGLVQASDVGIRLEPAEADRILDVGRGVRAALNETLDLRHPESGWIRGVSHVLVVEPVTGEPKTARNTVVFGENGVGRDPCGAGTSARMAQLHARGELAVGETFVHEGLMGTAYVGRVTDVTQVGENAAVATVFRGSAYMTGTATYLVDPADPLSRGFGVGYGSDVPAPSIRASRLT